MDKLDSPNPAEGSVGSTGFSLAVQVHCCPIPDPGRQTIFSPPLQLASHQASSKALLGFAVQTTK